MSKQTIFHRQGLRTLLFILPALFFLTGCAAEQFPNLHVPRKEPVSTRLKYVRPRVILVLGSGSARGFAHAGVIKVLEENHVPIDMIIGTSAGSIVGSLYADNPSSKDLIHTLLTTKKENVIDFSLWKIVHGPISGAALQNFLASNLHARTFDETKIPFMAVATDLRSGRIHVFSAGPIPPAVNASSAASPLFRPVTIYGHTYVDGGFVDPVAVDVARQFHPKIIIAVKLDDALDAEMPTNSAGTFLRGLDMMMLKLNEASTYHADVVISPAMGDIDMFESSQRARLMREGAIATLAAMPKIKRLLAKNHIHLRHH